MTRSTPLLLVSLLLLSACGKDVETYRVAKEAAAPPSPPAMAAMTNAGGPAPSIPAPARAAGATPRWTVPKGWTERPGSGMRVATFDVPGGAELSVIVLGGGAGGDLANVNRWRDQIGLPAIDEAELKRTSRSLRSKAGRLRVVEMTSADGASAVAGAILPKGSETWFFKLTGPKAAVAAARPALRRFLESLR